VPVHCDLIITTVEYQVNSNIMIKLFWTNDRKDSKSSNM